MWKEFTFINDALSALKMFNTIFERIIIVTNQQGIGKGLMSENDLNKIHQKMLEVIETNGGRINKIYYAPNLANENSVMRKPNTGMALQAQKDFPEIDFNKAVIMGDSATDIQMGRKLGMVCVAINNTKIEADLYFESLAEIAKLLEKE
ncbi:UNVERIFIED_CONTAM: hypothetical protein GTU68_049695 [Idotea baltica]|nr:hypothetical protein [Idotea baltica]